MTTSAGDAWFLAGLILFTLASVVCAVAPSFGWLLAGRGLQGLGAALLMPNSLAILGSAFAGEARGRAIGTWAAVGALAGALGPILGGWMVRRGRLAHDLPHQPADRHGGRLPRVAVRRREQGGPPGGLARLGRRGPWQPRGLGLLTWSLTQASAANGGGAGFWLACGGGVALLAAFIGLEHRRGDRAIMPLAMFGAPTFVGLTLLTFFLYGALSGLLVLLPFLLIRVEHWTAVAAGAALLPVADRDRTGVAIDGTCDRPARWPDAARDRRGGRRRGAGALRPRRSGSGGLLDRHTAADPAGRARHGRERRAADHPRSWRRSTPTTWGRRRGSTAPWRALRGW